ncbi:hypothetical protein Tco_0112108 [Tanacetum coccineum]
MPPKRTTRSSPATITTPTTSVTDEKLKRLIAQGVADVLAEREVTRSGNGEDSHDSGMGGRRTKLLFSRSSALTKRLHEMQTPIL